MRLSTTRFLNTTAARRRVQSSYIQALDLQEALKVAADDTTELPIVCVTGASGYLASELVGQLLDSRKYRVRGTVRNLADSSKTEALYSLPGAEQRLELMEADLLDESSFAACVDGTKFVFHTASPFVTSGVEDPQAELIDPALLGTESVMRAAVAAGVERVVLTSSVAAVMGTLADKPTCFDEDDWNTTSKITSECGLDLYRLSKKLAEEAAWKIADDNGLELATILPSFMVGPPRLSIASGESVKNMKELLEGRNPPRADTPMADVRDTATAHILAAEVPEAAGNRFLISTTNVVRMADAVRVVAEEYPSLEIVDPTSVGDLEPHPREVFRSKTVGSILPLQLRPYEESVLDMANAMLTLGSATPQFRHLEVEIGSKRDIAQNL